MAKLTAADGAADDFFGYSVAVSGDTALVGAWGDDDLANLSGSAYIFARRAGGLGGWVQVAKVNTSDGEAEDRFGFSVAISGDTTLVGAWGDDDLGTFSGSASIFARGAGGSGIWGQVAKLTASDGQAEDFFGWSVALSDDTALVAAPMDDDLGKDSGSAYVFERDVRGPTAWGQAAKLTAADGATGDLFGDFVATSGDTALVGALADDDLGKDSGSAYLFERQAGGPGAWELSVKLTAADGQAEDFFGWSVALSGDVAVVGTPGDDDLGSGSGSARVFGEDVLFEDGFESGDASAWAEVVP